MHLLLSVCCNKRQHIVSQVLWKKKAYFIVTKRENEIKRISILMFFIPQLVSCTHKDGTNRSEL